MPALTYRPSEELLERARLAASEAHLSLQAWLDLAVQAQLDDRARQVALIGACVVERNREALRKLAEL